MSDEDRQRLKIVMHGAVQGVGFRPFVYRLATELRLNGWILNSAQGVLIEVEGSSGDLRTFQTRLQAEKPSRAVVQSLEPSFLDPIGYRSFQIRESADIGVKTAFILPDVATCVDCLHEIFDPANRRFRYPFTNCTNCGPRFSIIDTLPYDRGNTSMKAFAMCKECEREYHDPADRRFHAQPNACPSCGPHLELWDENGNTIAEGDSALVQSIKAVRAGKILALKGLGGFQLMVDATNESAVLRLRDRKHREEKPFALMFPTLNAVRSACEVSKSEERLLLSPESPIVLLRRNCRTSASSATATGAVALQNVAPGNPNLGVMLPYTPLHHLLMRELSIPVVATSGNLSDEPICIAEDEALQRLDGIADLFLIHDRPIVRHVDDSIVRVLCGRELILRRARGYAPLPISVRGIGQPMSHRQDTDATRTTVLAVGAHLKNTVALKLGRNVFLSQHIGDLETKEAYEAFERTAEDLPRLYDVSIDAIACDLHPDYLSTKFADTIAALYERRGEALDSQSSAVVDRRYSVQHHWAHVASCMAENEIGPPVLGVAWDGTGFGLDGTIWGGEFLLARDDGWTRVAHLRQFRLPGGDAAAREPRRSALGLLYEIVGDKCWSQLRSTIDITDKERALLKQMLQKKVNAPLTSSAGRLFDAVASITDLRQRATFEGQAAMELEFAAHDHTQESYPFGLGDRLPTVIDWAPTFLKLLNDVEHRLSVEIISARFHNTLVEMIVAMAKKIGKNKIVLTGGCFQNRYLTERAIRRLREEKFRPYWHQRVPPNDGGIALGQCVAAGWDFQAEVPIR